MSMQSPRDVREWQQAVERQLKSAKNGTRIAIAHATEKVDKVVEDNEAFKALTPAAPVEVTYGTSTYIDATKRRRGKVTVDFPDVVFSTTGKAVNVENYELAGQDQGINPLEPFQTLGSASQSSIVAAGFNPGSTWKFKVRARGGSTVKAGLWSTEQTVTITADTTAPPQPSTPVVVANGGAVKVTWDGLAAGGGAMPGDFDHVEVAFALTTSPTTVITSFYAADFDVVPKSAYNQPHYFRFRAFDTSGNASPWSVQASATPVPLVDADVILSAIDAATTAITNIGTASILNGAINSSKLANAAVDATKLATAINDAIAKGVSAYDGQASINSDISALQTSVSGKNKIVNSLSIASGTTGYVGGDRWQQWSSLGTGGKLLASWRYNGSAWDAELIDPVYIPQIDLGAGTFGTFNGGRLEVNSVIAAALKVSDLTNFAPSQAESAADWALSGGMTIGATSLDPSGYRFNAFENTGTAWANGPYKAVRPGDSLYATATVYRNNVGTATDVFLRYYWYDKDKVMITPYYTGTTQAASSPNGTKLELTATAPAGAAYARLSLPIAASAGAGSGTHTGFYLVDGYKQNSSVTIADGAVNAAKVVANSMTAKQILIGDFQNFAIGSDFEDATAVPWTLASAHAVSTTTKKSGTQSLRLTANAGVQTSTFIGDLRVKEGEQYYFKYHAYIDSAFNGGTGNSKLRVGDQSGALIADKTYANITRSVWTTTPLELTVTVPAGVTSLSVTLTSDHTAGVAYIDDIQIRRVSEQSLIMSLGVEKLVATSASMVQATIDKLWTDVVRSRRMTTDMLAVGRGVNGIVDEFFNSADTKTFRDTLAGGWGVWDVSVATSLNVYTAGTLTAGTSRSFYFDTGSPTYDKASYIPVEPGQKWRLSVMYTSGTSGPRATIRVIKRDGTNAYTSVGWTKRDGTGNSYGTSGSLQTLERVYEVPADVAFVMPAVQFEATCTSATVYGGATFTNMMTPSLVVDGAIATRHLTVTQDMTVKLLSVYQIQAHDIDTNDLTADTGFIASLTTTFLTTDKIKAINIDATGGITSRHTITGATFQTSATALTGIKISGGYLRAYDAGNQETFAISGVTGSVVGTGLFRTGRSGNYAELNADGNGGLLRFWTGNGTGRGTIYARDDAGGARMTLTFQDIDNPASTIPLVAVMKDRVNLSYGSKRVQVWDNAGTEELLLESSGANIVVRGGIDMREGGNRVRFRYQTTTQLGYIGQRPESGTSADFEVRADAGGVRLTGSDITAFAVYNNTTASAANVNVDSGGVLRRVSSASRYKADQRVMALPDSLLDIPVKDWLDKAALSEKARLEALPEMGALERERYAALTLYRIPGVIAEDVESAGGEPFVIYGNDGRTESVMYDRLAVAQIAVLKRQLDNAMILIEELRQHVYNA